MAWCESIQDNVDKVLGTGEYSNTGLKTPNLLTDTHTHTTLGSTILEGEKGDTAIRLVETTEKIEDGTATVKVKVHDTFSDVSGPNSEITQRYHQETLCATVEPEGQVAKVTIHHTEDTGQLTNSLVEKESLSNSHNHHKLEEEVADYNEQRDTTEVELYQKKASGQAKKVFSTGFEVFSQEKTVWEHSRSRSRSGDRVLTRTAMDESREVRKRGDNTKPAVMVETTAFVTAEDVTQVALLYGSPCEDVQEEKQGVWKIVFSSDKQASLFLYALQKDLFMHTGFLKVYHDHEEALDTDGPGKRGRERERRRENFSEGVRSRSRSRSKEMKQTNVERVCWTE